MPVFPPELFPRTVPDLLNQQGDQLGDQVGFVAQVERAGYTEVSFAAWRHQADSVAAALAKEFLVRKGECVAWMLPNDLAGPALVLYHAVARLGAVNVPINDRLTSHEVGHILQHCQARVLIVDERRLQVVLDALSGLDGPVSVVTVGASTEPADGVSCRYADLLETSADGFGTVELSYSDAVCLVYTSGTTGLPKGVLHTHGSAITAGLQWADVFRLRRGEVLQSPFPIFSGAGLHFNGLSSLWAGATFVVEAFDPAETFRSMAAFGTTVYVAVPTVYRLVLDQGHPADHDLERLRILDYGGASMPTAFINELRATFPKVGIMQTYGLTEAGPGGIYLPEEYVDTELGSVGNRPMGRYTEFRVVAEDGTDVGPGDVGEFILRGPSLMKEYFRDPEATASAIRDGWLWTGDIVRLTERGFVYHVDRRKDLVVRGGYNISSAEVESVLVEHPAVQEAAVVAKPHATLGEDVKAYIVLLAGSGATVAELVAHCSARLADWKVPRDIEVRQSLPKNAAGKVLKRELRDEAAGATGSSIEPTAAAPAPDRRALTEGQL
jgi:acyl-CoA synthetase (AMP-forming)/AMP-acid ligase II